MIRSTFIPLSRSDCSPIDYLKGMLVDARTTTLNRIATVEQDELDWVYQDGWNSIAALLAHFISNDNYFRILFMENRKLSPHEEEKWLPGQELGTHVSKFKGLSKGEIVNEMAKSQSALFSAIETITFDSFVAKRDGYNPETGFNQAWALYHLAEDEIHHRGQISIIRNLYKSKVV